MEPVMTRYQRYWLKLIGWKAVELECNCWQCYPRMLAKKYNPRQLPVIV